MSTREKVTLNQYETFLTLPENVGLRFELIRGEIVEKMPTYLHAYIISRLNILLGIFLLQHSLGVTLVEARFLLPDDENDVIPDLSFVAQGHGPAPRSGAIPYPPDLAVEAQSDGQSERFMLDKALTYLANGTRMVWIIYSNRQIVEVLTATDRQLLTIDDTLTGGDVLPGFSVAVRDLFPPEVSDSE